MNKPSGVRDLSVPHRVANDIELQLTIEPRSHLGDFGDWLETGHTNIARLLVKLDGPFTPMTKNIDAPRHHDNSIVSYPAIVGESARRLLAPDDLLWMVGEIGKRDGSRFQHQAFPMFDVFSDVEEQLDMIAGTLTSDPEHPSIWWPSLRSEYGPHLFVTRPGDSNIKCQLTDLRELVRKRDREVMVLWKEMLNKCQSIRYIEELCDECEFVVLPDGPHQQQFSFLTARISVNEIAAALQGIAHDSGIAVTLKRR